MIVIAPLLPSLLQLLLCLWTIWWVPASSCREGDGTPLQYSCLENPMDGGAWWAAVHGVAESDTTEQLHFHVSLSRIGEGNGNPLQCSCLENPRDGGAWWAAIYGVAQSRTRLKRLSSSSSSPLWACPVALSWERIRLQCERPGFDPWLGKIPWRRERLLTPIFWPGEFHGLYSPWCCKESEMTERLSLSLSIL